MLLCTCNIAFKQYWHLFSFCYTIGLWAGSSLPEYVFQALCSSGEALLFQQLFSHHVIAELSTGELLPQKTEAQNHLGWLAAEVAPQHKNGLLCARTKRLQHFVQHILVPSTHILAACMPQFYTATYSICRSVSLIWNFSCANSNNSVSVAMKLLPSYICVVQRCVLVLHPAFSHDLLILRYKP